MNQQSITHIIGIDPGLDGATVCIGLKSTSMDFFTHKAVGRSQSYDHHLDAAAYIRMATAMAQTYRFSFKIVFIETPAVMNKQAGMRTVGVNWGIVAGAWEEIGFRYLMIPANVWKPVMVGRPLSRQYGKESSIIVARDKGYAIPSHAANGKKLHDGVADAILIAEYGARKLSAVIEGYEK